MIPSEAAAAAAAATHASCSSPELSPSVMAADAGVQYEEIFGAKANETFFSNMEILAASPPPSSGGMTSPLLQWSSLDGAPRPLPCDPVAASAAPSSSFTGQAGAALPPPSSSGLDSSRAHRDSISPLPGSSSSSDRCLSSGTPRPPPDPENAAGPTDGEGLVVTAGAPGAGIAPPLPRPPPPHPAPAGASRAAKPPGSSKSRARGGGARQTRKPKAAAADTAAARKRAATDPDDGEVDHTVCLLAVGNKGQPFPRSGISSNNTAFAVDTASSLGDLVRMLTVEMSRNGRKAETEHVENGKSAVVQVTALAGCDMRFGIVVLEVEESLSSAAATARELKTVSPVTPIVAVAPPQLLQCAPREAHIEACKHFNEILEVPVSAATVRGLATRYLLQRREVVEAVATSGMVGEDIGPAPWMTRAGGGTATAATTTTTLVSSAPSRGGCGSGGAEGALQQQQGGGTGRGELRSGAPPGPLSGADAGVLGASLPPGFSGPCASRRAPDVLAKPRASMPSPSPNAWGENGPLPVQDRVFGGGPADRESPCRIFGQDFERQNAEMDTREYDFMFRHGTIVLRVEEDESGKISSEIFSACEYATAHFGDITGEPLQSMFEYPATNRKTAEKIIRHIEKSDTDSMCGYINLKRLLRPSVSSRANHKSEVRWMTSAFVSVRALSKRPERGPDQKRLPPWYVILKVCLPSTIGLIKEPELLENMYSKKAEEAHKRNPQPPKRSRKKAGSKRPAKKAKGESEAEDDDYRNNEGCASGEAAAD